MDEYKVVAAPKLSGRKYSVFKLHQDDHVNWSEAKMRRDNEFQPWQIKFGSGRTSRRFKAIKEGGVGENASYFIFYKPENSSDKYEVCPIDDWFSVSATQRYKTLTAEEAEQKFEQRHKTLNLFSVMHIKKNGDPGEDGGTVGSSKAFKVSELDDWDNSGDDYDGSEGDNSDDESKQKNKKKRSIKKEKDEPENVQQEAKEDSDEGDFEQREVDYMSDTSSDSVESGDEAKDEDNVKSIAEEAALRDLLSTDDEEEEVQRTTIKSSLGADDIKQESESSDSDDYDVDEDKMDSLMRESLPAHLVVPTGSDVLATAKRKIPDDEQPAPPPPSTSRRPRLDDLDKPIEELVKKYLRRKPLPLKALLKDIRGKLKRQGADVDSKLVETIAEIIKRLDPVKQKINDVTYFSLPN